MAKIVVAPYGSLGDLHPFLAVALELRDRGHRVDVATLAAYDEKIAALGFAHRRLRPEFTPEDRETARIVMGEKHGTERLIREYLLPNLREMYEDLLEATEGAQMLLSGEIVYAARSVAEKRGLKWVSTSLAPLSMFSACEPIVFPNARYLRYLDFLGRPFRRLVLAEMRRTIRGWLGPYREFRSEIGLSGDHDPIAGGKFSNDLHLAMFSKALGPRNRDWPASAVQTGFCFYDGQKDLGTMPDGLEEFLDRSEPPIVFTLGSAAVMDAGDFFEESIKAAKMLGRSAVVLYGIFNDPPKGVDDIRSAYDYAPFSRLFPRAACVVHQGGVGTTAQVLKAGVPHLIVPFSHDQPDNAARCRRRGVARMIDRKAYNAGRAGRELGILLSEGRYRARAEQAKGIISSENGTSAACDAIERVLEG